MNPLASLQDYVRSADMIEAAMELRLDAVHVLIGIAARPAAWLINDASGESVCIVGAILLAMPPA